MTVTETPLAEVAAALRAGEHDPVAYAGRLCDRVDERDPEIRAFYEECDRRGRVQSAAEGVADSYDPDGRPPLFGVPVGVKDIVHVDGFTTRAGSALPPELFGGDGAPEAAVVERLREAGAVVLGKTVTTEFAGFAPGLTRNPHNTDHTPGGSSSGSAAAVAAGMTPLALGTQTGGSVVRPAAFCGIVGFKPSFDRVPTDGVLTRSASVDHVGLFTQDVAGARLAASALCDGWERAGGPGDRSGDTGGRPTLGVPEGPYLDRADPEGLAAFREQVAALADAGYEVVRARPFEAYERVDRQHLDLTTGEVAREHEAWFAEYEPFYRTTTAETIREGLSVSDERLAGTRAGRERTRERVHGRMDAAGVDLWVCPAAPGPAPGSIATTGDSVMNRPWTYAGLPAVTVPAGRVDGLPVGLQCVGRFGSDERLLARVAGLADALGTV
ncbi:amidase [Salinirussus salinus]|uniref:amidase n=1 Tax=Salinirussus salinus TaxID=1198300 RepID=UPI001357824A|nr:amidase [Salinirussus salinus]